MTAQTNSPIPPAAYLAASRFIQYNYSLKEIQQKWNDKKLGRPAKVTTIKRWLNIGPKTKNEYFEPFIMDWVDEIKREHAAKSSAPKTKQDDPVDELLEQVKIMELTGEHKLFATINEEATVASFLARITVFINHNKFPVMSKNQKKFMDDVVEKLEYRLKQKGLL